MLLNPRNTDSKVQLHLGKHRCWQLESRVVLDPVCVTADHVVHPLSCQQYNDTA